MSRSRENLIFAMVTAALLVGFWFLVDRPQRRQLNELNDQIARASAQVAEDATEAQRIPAMRIELERLRAKYADIDQGLPSQQELHEFLREISMTARSQNLIGEEIQPGTPHNGPLYNRLPIVMNFQCSFADLVGFLNKLDRMKRMTRVESLRVTPLKADSGQLQVRMQVNIYFTKS